MAKEIIPFETFLAAVEEEHLEFVEELHEYLIANDCVAAVEAKRSGYFVSYFDTKTKKAIVNFLFRKKGMVIRIYGGNVNHYIDVLDTLPEGMIASIKKASVCKRMLDPNTCISTCSMGNDFIMKGERMQKCRNSCFMFDVSAENNPYIKTMIICEMEERIAQLA